MGGGPACVGGGARLCPKLAQSHPHLTNFDGWHNSCCCMRNGFSPSLCHQRNRLIQSLFYRRAGKEIKSLILKPPKMKTWINVFGKKERAE